MERREFKGENINLLGKLNKLSYIQVHFNKLACHGKVHLFQ